MHTKALIGQRQAQFQFFPSKRRSHVCCFLISVDQQRRLSSDQVDNDVYSGLTLGRMRVKFEQEKR
jgi:hypothetical protein